LYYVAGIETLDGTHYSPWMAIQDESGLLTSRGSAGYLSFPGKNNSYSDAYGHVLTAHAKMVAGRSDLPPFGDGNGFGNLNEAEARRFFSTEEAKQAKLILMSATY
jgi:hypothetical protein